MSPTSYLDRNREAAVRFLQTAIVVDDAATVEPLEESAGSARRPGLAARIRASEPDQTPQDPPRPTGSDAVRVKVKPLSDALAEFGITCGVLRPDPGDDEKEITDRVVRVSERVDLAIVDWTLDQKREIISLEAIRRIVERDRRGCRVIAIYTSQQNLDQIADELMEKVPNVTRLDGDEPVLSVGGTRIALFRKAEAAESDSDGPLPAIGESELAKRLIDVFQEAVQGWVRTAALNTMAAMRENFHAVLDRLDPSLDVGYAGHLLRLDHLDDGAGQLLDSIGGELRGVVEDDPNSQASADPEALKSWIDYRGEQDELAVPADLLARYVMQPAKEQDGVRDEAFDALKNRDALPDGVGKRDVGRNSTALFIGGESLAIAEGAEADGRFAVLMSLRHRYGNNEPMLRLGTVVSDADGTKYWLCIQPDCDSVRLHGRSLPFPFIPLTVIEPEEKGTAFHLVVPSTDSVIRLFNPAKAATVTIYKFDPKGDTKTVRFRPDKSDPPRLIVKSTGNVPLYWVGQLKPVHATRVAHRLGEAITRIGLDESEWLRKASQLKGRPDAT